LSEHFHPGGRREDLVGQRVRVQLTAVDVERGFIDFQKVRAID